MPPEAVGERFLELSDQGEEPALAARLAQIHRGRAGARPDDESTGA